MSISTIQLSGTICTDPAAQAIQTASTSGSAIGSFGSPLAVSTATPEVTLPQFDSQSSNYSALECSIGHSVLQAITSLAEALITLLSRLTGALFGGNTASTASGSSVATALMNAEPSAVANQSAASSVQSPVSSALASLGQDSLESVACNSGGSELVESGKGIVEDVGNAIGKAVSGLF